LITRLAHAELGVIDLEAAREFYVDLLGFVEHEATSDALYLRAPGEFDVWSLKLTKAPTGGMFTFGLRVPDLDDVRAIHGRLDIKTETLAAGSEPGRGEGIRVRVPGGHTVDFHHEIDEVSLYDADGTPRLPERNTHIRRGLGAQRIDHVNLRAFEFPAAMAYWTESLDFSISEMQLDVEGNPRLIWMRHSTSSHEVAMGAYERPGFHHVAYTVADVSALSRAADCLADAGLRDSIEFGPGRHGVSSASMLYVKDPSDNRVEVFTGDYARDGDREPIRWTAEAYQRAGMLWWGGSPAPSFRVPGPMLEPSASPALAGG
jgi:catechol 2,3-dioxygenase